MKLMVVDLDGTLCNCAHREEKAQAGLWDEFHSQLMDDPVHQEVLDVLCAWGSMGGEYQLVGLTGRNEKWRMLTERWLDKNLIPLDEVLMRPDGDWRPDHVLKPAMLADWLGQNEIGQHCVSMILEDRDKVVEAWRNLGFTCWQVRQGAY